MDVTKERGVQVWIDHQRRQCPYLVIKLGMGTWKIFDRNRTRRDYKDQTQGRRGHSALVQKWVTESDGAGKCDEKGRSEGLSLPLLDSFIQTRPRIQQHPPRRPAGWLRSGLSSAWSTSQPVHIWALSRVLRLTELFPGSSSHRRFASMCLRL